MPVLQLARTADHARCPVRALEAWLRVSETRFGPVFRKIDRWGTVEHRRLGADAVRRILDRRTPHRRRSGRPVATPAVTGGDRFDRGDMTRSAAAKAEQAADAVQAWLETQTVRPDLPHAEADISGQPEATIVEPCPEADSLPMAPVIVETQDCDGSTGGLVRRTMPSAPSLRSVHTDWLFHRLRVTGPSGDVAAFRAAAAGAGIVPWQLDLDRAEEDLFHPLVAPTAPQQRSLSLEGARILARQLRDAVDRRHQIAVTRVGRSRACPFDLHALLPVPGAILRLGPDEPETLAWLWEHWGTPEGLRHVAEDPARDLRQKDASEPANFQVTFWSADWTPWRALASLERRWPALRFAIRPSYDRA